MLTTSYIAKKMNLPGLDYEVAKVIKNKYKVRHTLLANKVDDITQYYEVSNVDFLNEINRKIKFPVMVKPCDGSGSKSAQRVDSNSELKDACNEAIKSSMIGKALIEDFIEGKEYGVESFVHNGKVHVLGVIGKYMTAPPNYAELGHFVPSRLNIKDKVREVTKKAIENLGINYGAVNMDVLVTEDNRVCIIDIGARMGGNLIGSHLIPEGIGIDYIDLLVRAAVGDSFDLEPKNLPTSIVTRLLALKPGKVKQLPDLELIKETFQVNIYHHLQVGSKISEYHDNLDGFGYVISKSDNIQDAKRRAEKVVNLIDQKLVRE